jgi:hypothetical protein
MCVHPNSAMAWSATGVKSLNFPQPFSSRLPLGTFFPEFPKYRGNT